MTAFSFTSIVGCDEWVPPYSRSREFAKRPVEDLFWEKVDKSGPQVRPELSGCWIWKLPENLS